MRGTNRTGTPRLRETHPLSRNALPRRDHHRDLKTETLVKLSGTSSQRPRPKAKKKPLDRGSWTARRPAGRPAGPPDKLHPATPSHCRIVTRTQLRTHARNANASAIEIDFPVRVLSHDCITPPTSDTYGAHGPSLGGGKPICLAQGLSLSGRNPTYEAHGSSLSGRNPIYGVASALIEWSFSLNLNRPTDNHSE